MITTSVNGRKAGELEVMDPEEISEGLKVHIDSASPFAIGWKISESGSSVTDDSENNDSSQQTEEQPNTTSLTEEKNNTGSQKNSAGGKKSAGTKITTAKSTVKESGASTGDSEDIQVLVAILGLSAAALFISFKRRG